MTGQRFLLSRRRAAVLAALRPYVDPKAVLILTKEDRCE